MCATVGNWATGRNEDAVPPFREVACLNCQPVFSGILLRAIVTREGFGLEQTPYAGVLD
jgi:hypothetical protein